MDNRPIGVMDSGVGGLTVTKELLKAFPNESFLYVADVLGYPYGDKKLEDTREYILDAFDILIENDVKMIVIACNTATAAIIDIATEKYDIPILGVIEAASRNANNVTKNNKVLVLATVGTVDSKFYDKALTATNKNLEVASIGCPKFAPFIEALSYKDEEAALKVIDETLNEFKSNQSDTVILGCTHYPILKNHLEKYFNYQKVFVDSAAETIKDVTKKMDEDDSHADDSNKNSRFSIILTAPHENFETILKDWIKDEDYTISVAE